MLALVISNLRTCFMSLFGFITLEIVLERTSGRRMSRPVTWTVWMIAWCVRYFGLNIYVSDYLAGLYQGQDWFSLLVLFLNIGNIWFGMAVIALLFKGRLRKNMVTTACCEILFSFWTTIPYLLHFLWSKPLETRGNNVYLEHTHILDLTIPISFGILIWFILRFGDPFFIRYSRWHSAHPALVYLFLILYLAFGMFSNIQYILREGNIGIALFCTLVFLVFGYIYYDYIFSEREKEKKLHMELIYHEKTLKSQYDHMMEKSVKLEEYNREIQAKIEKLIEKSSIQGSYDKDLFEDESVNLRTVAEKYLEDLRQQLNKVSVHLYCDDHFIDHLLGAYEVHFRTAGVKTVFSFQDYFTPQNLAYKDIEAILRWMINSVSGILWTDSIHELKKSEDAGCRYPISELWMHGGIIGKELIFNVKAFGSEFRKPETRTVRIILNRLKADMVIERQDDLMKIVIGIPV